MALPEPEDEEQTDPALIRARLREREQDIASYQKMMADPEWQTAREESRQEAEQDQRY